MTGRAVHLGAIVRRESEKEEGKTEWIEKNARHGEKLSVELAGFA